jgi:hypothetical protein
MEGRARGLGERGAAGLVAVAERHPSALPREGGQDGRADAGRATGDEDRAAFASRMERRAGSGWHGGPQGRFGAHRATTKVPARIGHSA